MSELTSWEKARRKHVNFARAEKIQSMLEEAGYFKKISGNPHVVDKIPAERVLLNFLVDYLHLAEKEGKPLDLSTLLELAQHAHALYEKEPRFQ